MADYRHPEVLVSTEWVAENLNAPNTRWWKWMWIRRVRQGHIPSAVDGIGKTQLQDNVRRDLIDKAALEALLSSRNFERHDDFAVTAITTTWFAAYAFWQLKYHGHENVKLINGGARNGGRKACADDRGAKVTRLRTRRASQTIRFAARRDEVLAVCRVDEGAPRGCAFGG